MERWTWSGSPTFSSKNGQFSNWHCRSLTCYIIRIIIIAKKSGDFYANWQLRNSKKKWNLAPWKAVWRNKMEGAENEWKWPRGGLTDERAYGHFPQSPQGHLVPQRRGRSAIIEWVECPRRGNVEGKCPQGKRNTWWNWLEKMGQIGWVAQYGKGELEKMPERKF